MDSAASKPEAKRVEECFVREGMLLELHAHGQIIRTTTEHPFYAKNRGWTPAGELQPGDLLATHDGRWIPVAALQTSGHAATVYNLRIADYHTCFVGSPAWGFSVWAHAASQLCALLGNELAEYERP